MNKHGSKWISRNTRLAIYLRDGMACAYCGSTLEDGITLTLDHVIAREHGGDNKPSNLLAACTKCNSSKNARDIVEFVETVAAYVNHGISAEMIMSHISDCLSRNIKPFQAEAREITNRRPSWSDALQAASRR